MLFFFSWCLRQQEQFKNQGNKLTPENKAEVALMYQRMFEGLSLFDKISKLALTLKEFKAFHFYCAFKDKDKHLTLTP